MICIRLVKKGENLHRHSFREGGGYIVIGREQTGSGRYEPHMISSYQDFALELFF